MEQESIANTPPPRLRWVGLLGLLVGAVVAGLFFLQGPAPTTVALPPDNEPPAALLFQGWGKPDLAIVVSGEMHGYLQPCGCSDPQKGGMARRYNFIDSLKAKKWQVVAVDLGDIAAPQGPMGMLKYTTSMRALQLMGYSAIGTGQRELAMPLHDALGAFSLNNDKPRPVALNLTNTANASDVFYMLNARQYEVVGSKPKIGVIGVVGPDVAKDVRDKLPPNEMDIKFGNNGQLVGPALAAMAPQGVEFGVLLYQGSEKKALDCADFCHNVAAKGKLPPVRLILCLADNEAPPGVASKSAKAPETHVVSIGHKGIYVGVVGFFRKGKGYDVKYQLVTIGPEYQNKPGQEKANPVSQLMEEYTREVKAKNFLGTSPRGEHTTQVNFKNAYYVGSERCADCHEHAYKVWKNSKHAHAYDALVKAKDPSLRQFDPECIACHTVGFKDKTGYFDVPQGATAKQIEKHNAKLLNVGCESCHGPASVHVNNPNDKDLYPVINPLRPNPNLNPAMPAAQKQKLFEARMLRVDFSCQKCHDIENDVHWGNMNFIQTKWMQIEHADPKKKKEGGAKLGAVEIRRPSAGIDPPEGKAFPKGDAKMKDD